MKDCPICHKPSAILRTGIKEGKLITERCERCLNSYKGFSDYAKKFDRDSQRRTYAKDILQKWDGDKLDPKYVDSYPEQFDEKTRRDYGINRKQF